MTDPAPTGIPAFAYRELMREFAAGVSVITTGSPGTRRGLTATAVCSLSDEPPTLLVCVNKRASAHDDIVQQRRFAVNVLAADQIAIAQCFSGQTGIGGEERFALGQWATLITGAPVLADALIALDCLMSEHLAMSTHTIIVGTITAGYRRPNASALVYRNGTYHHMN